MTSKLKCPFCGAELQTDNEIARLIMWRCHTPGCLLNGWHSAEIIQHLIDGKKAQDAIQKIKDIVYPALDREFYSELRDDMLDISRIIVSVAKQEE